MDTLMEQGYTEVYEFVKEQLSADVEDDMSKADRDAVDDQLEKARPLKRTVQGVTTVVPMGASGYVTLADEEAEDGVVDVLDDQAKPTVFDPIGDEEKVYDDDADARVDDDDAPPAKIRRSGALWIEGIRLSPDLVAILKPHQIEAIELGATRLKGDGGILLAHAMGLGKTLTVLVLLHLLMNPHRLCGLLICPKAVVEQWCEEAYKWRDFIDMSTLVVDAFDEKTVTRLCHRWQQTGGLLIVQYDQFVRVASHIQVDDETFVVLDEAHLVKNPTTDKYLTVSKLPTRRRILLTGTPLQNNLDEYYCMSELVSPGILAPSLVEFRKKYARDIERGMRSDATEEQRQASERVVQVLRWQMSQMMHDKSDAYLRQSIPSKREYAIHMNFPPIAETLHGPIVDYNTVGDLTRQAKVDMTVKLIDTIQQTDPAEAILVFASRNETLVQVQAQRPGDMYTGTTANAKRSTTLDDFNANGGVLYVAIRAGGTGLNLYRASRVILMDVAWNPCHETQAVSRAFRLGQTRPTIVYRLVASNTLEERIYRTNIYKHSMAARIKDDQDVVSLYSTQELKTQTSGTWVALAPSAIDDPVMRAVQLAPLIMQHIVVDHAALLPVETAQLSEEERNSALNDFHRMTMTTPRTLCVDEDDETTAQTVPPRAVYFASPHETKLVPPPAPFFERCIESYGGLQIYAAEPTIVDPPCDFKMQRGIEMEDGTMAWTDMHISLSVTGKVCAHVNMVPREGDPVNTYVFRTCYVDNGVDGPWSTQSASVTI